MYRRLLGEHEELLAYLEDIAKGHPGAAIASDAAETPRSEDDLSDLPPELLEQLSSRSKKGQTDVLVQIINDRGGRASLDEIIIDLYRKTGEIGVRNLIANRLYRLAKQDLVAAEEGKKGIYKTTKAPGLFD